MLRERLLHVLIRLICCFTNVSFEYYLFKYKFNDYYVLELLYVVNNDTLIDLYGRIVEYLSFFNVPVFINHLSVTVRERSHIQSEII